MFPRLSYRLYFDKNSQVEEVPRQTKQNHRLNNLQTKNVIKFYRI